MIDVKVFTPIYLDDIVVIEMLVIECKSSYKKEFITFNHEFGYNEEKCLKVYLKLNKLGKKLEYLFGNSLFVMLMEN